MRSFQLSITPRFPVDSPPVLEGIVHTEQPRAVYLLEYWFNEAELTLPSSSSLVNQVQMRVEEITPQADFK